MAYDSTTRFSMLAALPPAGSAFFLSGQPTHVVIAWLLAIAAGASLILTATYMLRFELNRRKIKSGRN
jgi:hypothetical protein